MEKLFKIGEVSKICNLSIKTLRFYEEENLITPVKVDIYTGYRYYDMNNIEQLFEIQLLKELGFTLKEISQFDKNSLTSKLDEIKQKIQELRKNIDIISSLQNQKGEMKMKPFICDEKAIGKWSYVCSAENREEFDKENCYVDESLLLKTLYFLPKGEGYWIFDRWTKGEIYHFKGIVYTYEIENDKLFLSIFSENNEFENLLIYKKEDSVAYTQDSIKIQDELSDTFVEDKASVGFWKVIDFISIKNKDKYRVNNNVDKKYYIKSLSLSPNSEAMIESERGITKISWSKNCILNQYAKTNSHYDIKTINGEEYLFMDWKSGDYQFAGTILGLYVFKKVQ